MKLNKYFVVLLLILPFVLMACTVPAAGGIAAAPGAVTEGQMYVVGIVASGLLYGLKLLAKAYPNITIRREWLTVVLYVIALALSVIWGGMSIPKFSPFTDPVTFVAAVFGWITALLLALAPSVAFATLIYNILLKRIFDGWSAKA